MSKITLLPPVAEFSGDEMVVLVKDGATARGRIGDLVEQVTEPHRLSAQLSSQNALTALAQMQSIQAIRAIYPTVAAGLTKTSIGEFFYTPGNSETEFLLLWVHGADNSAQPYGSLASASLIAGYAQALADRPIARTSLIASEPIDEDAFVNVYKAGGVVRIRNAIASDPDRFAHGFVSAPVAAGAATSVSFSGLAADPSIPNNASEVWLSDTDPGGFSLTPPNGAGVIIQSLGVAIAGVGIIFHPGQRTLL